MSLDEVKMKTSASQYVLWMEYLEWEVNAFDKTCYYLAQIAAEVCRPYAKKNARISLEDFILKFKNKKVEETETPEMEAKTSKLKQAFFGITGLAGHIKGSKRK